MRTKDYRGPFGALRRWNFRRVEARRLARETQEARLENDAATLEALSRLLEYQRVAGQTGADFVARLGLLDQRLEVLDRRLAALETRAPDEFPVVRTRKAALADPEIALLARLAPAIAPKVALDVGAHHGNFSEALLGLDFTVHAVEPNPAAREVLQRRLAGRPGLVVHPVAAGADDGEAELTLVEDRSGRFADPSVFSSLAGPPRLEGLTAAGRVRVPVRRLDGLLREAGLGAPGLVKVDAEGLDLDVLRGLGDVRPPLVVAEFWDEACPLSFPGARNRLPDLVAHGRAHGLPFHLAIFRGWGDDRPAFHAGLGEAPERSWGNVLLFADRSLWERARAEAASLLSEAHFAPPRGG